MNTASNIREEAVAARPPAGHAPAESELVSRAQAGGASDFGVLVTRYQDRLLNVCFRILGNREAAEDVTQEAFLKAFRSLGQFDARSGFYTWLYRIAVNLCLSERRRPKLQRSLAGVDDGLMAGPVDGRASRESPADAASRQEQHALVLAALAELDDEQRTVVVLRDIETLDYGEIAEILGVPVGTVKSRLHRARMAIRARLSVLWESSWPGT